MGEESYKLTESGEAKAVDILGGMDAVNVVAAFMHIIKTRGNLLNDEGYEPGVKTYMEFAQVVQLMKHCGNWEVLVKSCEELLEQETKYFEKNPHS